MDASYQNGLVALAGGGQTGATKIGGLASGAPTFNRFTTVASGNDSAILPSAAPGLFYVVKNAAAANSMNVYPAVGESINALSANAAFALAANKAAMFFCVTPGVWDAILTA